MRDSWKYGFGDSGEGAGEALKYLQMVVTQLGEKGQSGRKYDQD